MNQATSNAPQMPDLSALLQILNSQPQPVQQAPQPIVQTQPTGLEAIFAQFSSNNFATPQPQMPQQPTGIDPHLQAVLQAFNMQNQAQSYPTQSGQPQIPDLRALLSGYNQINGQVDSQQSYMGDYDRKRPFDNDDQRGNDQYPDGKRAKSNSGKKASLFLHYKYSKLIVA